MKCLTCGNEDINNGQNFCQICGSNLQKSVTKGISKDMLRLICEVQKHYAYISSMVEGIANIDESGIHMTESAFANAFETYDTEILAEETIFSKTIDGVKFFCFRKK